MLSEEKISCLHCPVPCSSWEQESLGPVGCAESPLQSCMLSLLSPLPTSIWTIARSSESSAGTGGHLWPMQCPCCTPASTLPHSRKSSRPSSDPSISQEWQQEQGWKAWKLMLLHCREQLKQSRKEALVPKHKNMDQGCFPEQQRAVSPAILIFKQY